MNQLKIAGIKMGDTVRHSVHGYTGRVTAFSVYAYGSPRCYVEKTELKDGQAQGEWFETAAVEVVTK